MNLNWLEFNFNTFLIIFIILNIINVIIQTIKTIITINGTPLAAAAINALTFAIYTVVIVFMNADGLGILWKALIIGAVNFIGVYIVKFWENKMRKEKLWKIELTVPNEEAEALHKILNIADFPHSYITDLGKYTLFNIYCETKAGSTYIKELVKRYHAKYFVTESKEL